MSRNGQRGRAVALAGGGPLGAIYEVGALMALSEALDGFDFNDLDAYVGVSAGGFIATGLACGLSPAYLYRMFIDSEEAELPFEPEMLLRPALHEYALRAGRLPGLIGDVLRELMRNPLRPDPAAAFARLARAIPAGVFDSEGIDQFLSRLFAHLGIANDFRRLPRRLFLVATELDSGRAVAFGSPGFEHVPVSRAVQASAALPGLFPPVKIGDHWYVDGALKKTLHASVALREGARLVFCINPLVPFDAQLAVRERHVPHRHLVDGGLPAVLAQTFRAIIHSRMKTGLAKYEIEYRDADVILFEPRPDDADMFFTNVFSYADRKRLAQLAYRRTREELLRRHDELAPKLARHGVSINRAVLEMPHGAPARRVVSLAHRRAGEIGRAALDLSDTLDDLARALRRRRSHPRAVRAVA